MIFMDNIKLKSMKDLEKYSLVETILGCVIGIILYFTIFYGLHLSLEVLLPQVTSLLSKGQRVLVCLLGIACLPFWIPLGFYCICLIMKLSFSVGFFPFNLIHFLKKNRRPISS